MSKVRETVAKDNSKKRAKMSVGLLRLTALPPDMMSIPTQGCRNECMNAEAIHEDQQTQVFKPMILMTSVKRTCFSCTISLTSSNTA
jgi:hypothetical protein